MKSFNLCYIDAFAGSGEIDIPGRGKLPGSAIRAFDYEFDRLIFIEDDPDYTDLLRQRIQVHPSGNKAIIYQGDCNDLLSQICTFPWRSNNWRGEYFLIHILYK